MNLFGAGILWGTPLQDANGNAIVNPTPVQFGTIQDVSVDISFDTKLLYGQSQFAIDAGRGKGKISLKAKAANVNGALLNSIFFGQTMTNGVTADNFDTTGTAVPTTPFIITPAVPNSGTWAQDLGVRGATGIPLTRVAASPTTGQYAVTSGAYTFAGADVGLIMYMSFQYTNSSTVAKKATVANLLMGQAPTFRCDLSVPRAPKTIVFTFNNCITSKLAIATKQDDFIIPEFDFDAFADSNGNVMSWAISE
jgi:hypothetical protein